MNSYSAVLQNLETSNQGGLVARATDAQVLERFLILGTLGGSFYVGEFKLTKDTTDTIRGLFAENYQAVLDTTVDISRAGRALSNTPALFVLAVGASYVGDNQQAIRRASLEVLPQVARTGTHLFEFISFIDASRGWGTGLRRGVANWYLSQRSVKSLAYGVTKYAQRNGWSHADVLRLSHPKAPNLEFDALFRYIVKGDLGKFDAGSEAFAYLEAVEEAKASHDPVRVAELIRTYSLPREVIPTQMLNDPNIWEALLYAPMPYMAMVRNAGNLHRAGLISTNSDAQRFYVERLLDPAIVKSSRIHPLDIVKADFIYSGHFTGRGKSIENPSTTIMNALIEASELAFGNIEPTGKAFMQGIDVSSSMTWGSIENVPMTSAEAAAYMAYQTAKVEKYVETYTFSTTLTKIVLPTSGGVRAAIKGIRDRNFGGTDVPLVISNAIKNRINVDVFAIYTDSENGNREKAATQVLREYRDKINPNARLAVVQTEVNRWSTTGNLPNTLEVVGFDTAVPQAISKFASGEV